MSFPDAHPYHCEACGHLCRNVVGEDGPPCAADPMAISPEALKWFDTFSTVRDALMAHGYPLDAATERAMRAVGKLPTPTKPTGDNQ